MRKYISLNSIFLFIIPIVTLLICLQIHVIYYELRSLPFIDGEASVSLIGRQEKTITIFKTGLFLYAIISVFFYFSISEIFLSQKIRLSTNAKSNEIMRQSCDDSISGSGVVSLNSGYYYFLQGVYR